MNFDDIINDFEEEAKPSIQSLQDEMSQVMLNERMAPELLPFENTLLNDILSQLSSKQQYLLDSHEYGDINAALGVIDNDFKLQLMIIETDIERVNYMVRLYLRTRLSKIDKFTIFYINEVNDPKNSGLLSPQEQEYIQRHLKVLTQLYNNSFLSKLPKILTLLDDVSGGLSMIVEPDLDLPVFIQYSGEKLSLQLDEDEELDLEKDGIYVVKYRLVKRLLDLGDVKLI